ncbi:MAG: peptidoglycan DD-metalloendopeptidase family protein [Clostridia bacterium]|nr:peptidoglycan DD-metalloendopeptidase family protein [Clostridia bacterium]
MKKGLFRFLTVFLLLFTAVAVLNSSNAPITLAEKTIQENKNEVSRLENTLGSKQSDIAYLRKQIDEAKKNVQNQAGVKNLLDKEIEGIQDEISITRELISQYEIQIEAKNNEISVIDSNINDAVELIKERLIIQHETGNSSMISFILGSNDFAELLTRIEIANELFEYDQEIIDGLNYDRSLLVSAQNELQLLLDKCKTTEEGLSSREAELETKVADATAYLNQLKSNETFLENSMAAKERELREIQNEIKELLNTIALQERADYSNDEFRFPLPYDVWYVNTGGFGIRYWNNGRQTDFHRGVDFAAAYGTDILATNSGTVIRSNYSSSFGNVVVIDHGGGICSLYAHASQRLVSYGDVVKKGDVIAKIGSTGDSTGNHLHFCILEDGEYVDPMNYISEP